MRSAIVVQLLAAFVASFIAVVIEVLGLMHCYRENCVGPAGRLLRGRNFSFLCTIKHINLKNRLKCLKQ